MVYRKGQTGVSIGHIENIGKKYREWQRKDKANCTKCMYLEFGYYWEKKRLIKVKKVTIFSNNIFKLALYRWYNICYSEYIQLNQTIVTYKNILYYN